MTDRDILVASFTAISALAERITGERMILKITLESGDTLSLDTIGHEVQWLPAKATLEQDFSHRPL